MKNVMQFGATIERLCFFILLLFLMCHLIGCMWIFVAKSSHDPKVSGDSWIEAGGYEDMAIMELYTVSLYFTM